MGWDILWVLVSPPLKRLLKGPPPPFPGFPPLGWQGYSKEQSSPRSRVYKYLKLPVYFKDNEFGTPFTCRHGIRKNLRVKSPPRQSVAWGGQWTTDPLSLHTRNF